MSGLCWGDDFNVSLSSPERTSDVVSLMSKAVGRDLSPLIRWHPEADYLGNHRLSSDKFRTVTGWKPKIPLKKGITRIWTEMQEIDLDSDYDPLIHLRSAAAKGIDLLQHFVPEAPAGGKIELTPSSGSL
jgi:hypothetical protein